ncbi:MAG: dTDP-4-dehydrorhamnose 3,5-epimerase family protein [Candidatus Lindowbacteria bacterium]|nr:dTDP-4-dehydrorhamnose 3,5-epimerase family protein [Candidatus Lindowbacteria bacterium]
MAIEGVIITPLRQIVDERGKIMHMLRNDADHFEKFGEIYFSCIHPGIIKAWHIHKEMTLNYAVPHGKIKFVLHDDREGSSSRGETVEICLGPDCYNLVTVPPMVWNGFMGLGTETSIVANCSSITHSPDEMDRCDPFDKKIGYDWNIKNG